MQLRRNRCANTFCIRTAPYIMYMGGHMGSVGTHGDVGTPMRVKYAHPNVCSFSHRHSSRCLNHSSGDQGHFRDTPEITQNQVFFEQVPGGCIMGP